MDATSRWLVGKLFTKLVVPHVSLCSGYPAAHDLTSVVASGCFAASACSFGGCFAVTVAGLLFCRCFAAKSVEPLPLWMLCRRGVVVIFFTGGCFAAVVAWLLADVLPLWSPGSLANALPRWSLGLLADALPLLLLWVDALPSRLGLYVGAIAMAFIVSIV